MSFQRVFLKEVTASVVVFLVALPLCLGIAIASGVPPLLGIVSGVIGGLIIAPFAGVSLQVSGPAAGLAVMVFQFVEKFGLGSLVWLGLIIGSLQFLAGVVRLGDFFRASSPALIKGMLGGIGLLILISQMLVGLEVEPTGSGFKNLAMIPQALAQGVTQKPHAFGLLFVIVGLIYTWTYLPKSISSKLPGSLVGVVVATFMAAWLFTGVKFIEIPPNVWEGLNVISVDKLGLFSSGLLVSALGIALVASAETLLSAVATDRMAKKVGSDYNKELRAQGLGNFVAGLLGALPITGVIVRSTANIEAGGKTRYSAVMHSLWLLLFVFGLPSLLNYIPIAGLAAILVVTGIKLLDVTAIPKLWKQDRTEFAVYLVTIVGVFAIDILAGVVLGFLTSILLLAIKTSRLDIEVKQTEKRTELQLRGVASFICIPKISKALASIESDVCCVDLSGLSFMDAAVKDQIHTWCEIARSAGKEVTLTMTVEDVEADEDHSTGLVLNMKQLEELAP